MRIVWFRGKFCAYERTERGSKRTSLGTTDRAVAERRLIDLQQGRRRKATTVAQMHADYLDDRGPHIASKETLGFAWKRLVPVFGHLRPDQITRALCRAYAARERRRGISDGSIRRDLGVLGAIVRHNDKSTPAIIEMPPAPPPKSRHLTREQYQLLRDAARAPHIKLFITVAYSTAGRAAAVLQLTWDRVDFDRGLIRLGLGERRTKGRATVPMTDAVREVLLEARRGALTDYVIEYAGRPVRSVKRAFKAAAARAGLPPGTSPHVLRHSAAVHMAESGVPMAEIAQFLGHSSESVTFRTYARYSPDYLRRAASALEWGVPGCSIEPATGNKDRTSRCYVAQDA
jgi:integrase